MTGPGRDEDRPAGPAALPPVLAWVILALAAIVLIALGLALADLAGARPDTAL